MYGSQFFQIYFYYFILVYYMAIKENFAIFIQEENFPCVSPSSLLSLVLDHFVFFFYHSLYHLLLSLDCHQLHISSGFSSDHHRLPCCSCATTAKTPSQLQHQPSISPIQQSMALIGHPQHLLHLDNRLWH